MTAVACALAGLLILAAALASRGMKLGDLRSLYDACSGRVMAAVLHLLRDRADAEDVVQEAFLELWRRAAQYDPARGSREAWAVVIARSRALDRLRARGAADRAAERAASEADSSAPPALDVAEARLRGGRVRAALSVLPEPQRRAIELAYFAGLSQSEIAAETGEPLGTVKTQLRLAMEKLAGLLAEEPP